MFNLEARIKLTDRMSGPVKTVTSAVKAMDRAMASTDDSVSSVTRSMTKSAATTRLIASGSDAASRSVRGLARENGNLAQSYRRVNSASGGGGGFGLSSLNPIGAATKIATAGFAAMAVAATAASYAVYKVSANALKLSSDSEQAQIAFTTMLGSADKSKAFLNELTDFANSTPFELPGLRDSAKRLLAFGFTSDKILPTLTGLGNAAAGLGLGADGVDRLTLALGQVKAKGRLQGDEAMQFTEAGVPVWDILAKKMHITTGEVIKLSSKGLIPAGAAINALIEGMNEKFPGMMDKQSKSLAGLWSTVKDTFNTRILTKWGDGIRLGIQPKLTQLTTWLDKNGATIQKWGDKLQKAASTAATAIAGGLSGAFQRIKTQYLDNKEFQELSFSGKINFVFGDVMKAFTDWYDAKGSAVISSITQSLIDALSSGVTLASPKIIEIGTTIGLGIGKGVLDGIGKGLADPGNLKKLNDAAGFLNKLSPSGVAIESVKKLWTDVIPSIFSGGDSGKKTPEKASSGIGFVPRDNMPVLVHRGERIQTKTQADADRSGRGGGNTFNFTMNGVTVRKDSDINAIAMELARLIERNEGAASVG